MTDIENLGRALAGRYEVARELGRGGMATVHLARDLRHDRQVALKVMLPELAAAIGNERFLREIQIAARLHHPHILALYDSGTVVVPPLHEVERGTGGEVLLYYVMPFVEGESLRDRLDRDRQLSIDDALQIAREVADALSYAHSHDVVHRDIKPENILLSSGHALVADFGIARAITAAGGERLTETGLSIGTPSYMSPEQAAGEKTIDGKSDIYSLGCVLYEMLAGEPPHTGPNAQAIIARRLTEPVTPLRTTRETIPPEIDDALLRSLARVPADRYATAADFATALHPPATASGAVAAAPAARHPFVPAALSTLALVAIVVIVMLFARSNTPATPADVRPTLAVLPFENLGAPEDEYFADGITEEMTSRLAEVSGLGVTSRTSTLRYKGTDRPLQEIGRELNVQYVLEGTVRTDRAPDGTGQVRVTPQLIRMSDDTHLWTDRYTASLVPGEIFAVQAQIAEQVAIALDVTLLGSEREALQDVLTDDPEAHDAYLLGRFHWNKRGAENLELAAGYFTRAIERDTNFAEAYSGLADTYALYGYYGVPGLTRAEAYARAEAAARRAIALDSVLAAAYASLGNILTYGAWDWEGAEREFRRAIALDPSYDVARYWYAELLVILGRLDDAIEQAERALMADPASLIGRHAIAVALHFQGHMEEAIELEREVIALQPDFVFSHTTLGIIYLIQERFDDAIEEFLLAGAPRDPVTTFVGGVRDSTLRRRAISRIHEVERQQRAERDDAMVDPFRFVVWYVLVGATDSAFARMEEAYRVRSETFVYSLRDPVFASLRGDPRYTELFRRLRLPPP